MDWKSSTGNRKHIISIPQQLTPNRWTTITIDKSEWQLQWQPRLSSLYLCKGSEPKAGNLEFCLRLKKSKLDKDPEELAQNILTETDSQAGLRVAISEVILNALEQDSRNQKQSNKPVKVRSPMVGKVLNIFVEEGQSVTKGQDLLIIEAMKMENKITCPCNGLVKELRVKIGQQVANQDDMMVILKPPLS